ncbi:MAG: hypothetical protein WC845_00640 [Candidatus Staskawiczbacteria bacterium]|jgi:hypothetical protein
MQYKRTKKKKVVSAAILATSAYTSVLFASGLILGYLVTKYFYEKHIENGPLKFINIKFKGWNFHLHHWIFGCLLLIFFFLGGWRFEFHKFLWGVLCGMIAHDIYDFNDWHQVLAKERE